MDAPSASLTTSALSKRTRREARALRVMIVDSDQASALTIERELSCQRHLAIGAVKTVGHGLDALIVGEQLQPDLVIIEIGWPRRSGACTAKLLRMRPWATKLVIVSHLRDDSHPAPSTTDFDFHFSERLSTDVLMQIYPDLVQRFTYA